MFSKQEVAFWLSFWHLIYMGANRHKSTQGMKFLLEKYQVLVSSVGGGSCVGCYYRLTVG